ncbi:hypothetical protein EYF80_007389 [Liparis tanakae]|uniref:Uncharacterized protein n=1 Tax=Liparis tanakae TaxID=230148 RepID=A0A4Z2IWA8_9TELE|nr:hypothetical protein EYF80_007389 [Liparis tanakae]
MPQKASSSSKSGPHTSLGQWSFPVSCRIPPQLITIFSLSDAEQVMTALEHGPVGAPDSCCCCCCGYLPSPCTAWSLARCRLLLYIPSRRGVTGPTERRRRRGGEKRMRGEEEEEEEEEESGRSQNSSEDDVQMTALSVLPDSRLQKPQTTTTQRSILITGFWSLACESRGHGAASR